MAVAPLVLRNAEDRKIPNPSLTGVTSVFSPQKRRKLEFSGVIHYNNSTEAFVPPRQPCGSIPKRLFTYLQFYGAIDMYDKYTFVEVPREYGKEVLEAMKNAKIKGRSVNMEPANQK